MTMFCTRFVWQIPGLKGLYSPCGHVANEKYLVSRLRGNDDDG